MNPLETAEAIKDAGIIAIIRGRFSLEALLQVGTALVNGGIRSIEVTLNTFGALDAISLLRKQLPQDILIGAGTVRSPYDVNSALDAGAQFLIAPTLDLASLEEAKKQKILLIPGVFTPTEAQMAANAGCSLLKLFPADVLGSNYLKSLKAPLDDLEFVPTGGITVGNLGDFIRAGAAALGVGSSLVRGTEQDVLEIQAKAKVFIEALRATRDTSGVPQESQDIREH